MKKYFKIIATIGLFLAIASCTSQKSIPSAKVASLLENGEFTFMAERANPTNFDVINVMNSLPNAGSSRILNLDYGYIVQVTKDELKVTLPYFGRMFSPTFDREKNSYRFTSKDFTVNKTPGKKGSSVYSLQIKDQPNIRKMFLEVFANGKSYLSIDSSDRQAISYDGYLMENEAPKK